MTRRSVACVLAVLLLGSSVTPDAARLPTQTPGATSVPARPPRDAPAVVGVGTGTLRGRVVAADGQRPLRRVQIKVSAPELGGGPPRTTSTDEDGRYEMTDLPAGRYTVTASRGGFLPIHYGQRRPREQGRIVEIADGQVAEGIDLALPKMSTISGRVTDEEGEPIAGVTVLAMRSTYIAGRRQFVATSPAMLRTDDLGEYRLGGLVPGTYTVSARSGDKWTVVNGGRDETMGYMPTYFPGTTNIADAKRIAVGLGDEVRSTDFALIPGRAATVSGTAYDSKGRPFKNVNLRLETRSETGQFFGTAGNRRVGPDGTFTFHDVAPGAYKLTAARTDDEPELAIFPITVEGFDLTGLSLSGSSGGTVSGRVMLDEGITAAMPRVSIDITERLVGQADPSMLGVFRGRYAAVTPSAGNGTFAVSHVFGPAPLNVVVPDDWMVKSIERNGRELADAPIELKNGEQLSDVQIVLTNRVTSVSGGLTNRDGSSVADGTVIVFTADRKKWFEGSRFVRGVRPDGKGRYVVKGLPPGDYLAVGVEYAEDGAWSEPEYLESLRQQAQPITIEAGRPRTVALRVVSVP